MEKILTRAILVDIIKPETSPIEAENRLDELEKLINTYGGIAILKTIQKKDFPDYQTYVGKGKVSEIIRIAEEKEADVLIINNLLKPRQVFELNERFRTAKLKMKAWDRVDLILKIFSKHAQSTEAKLQIELASIRHMGPRIFNMGIELSRQAGAMGLRAGQGESNTELMKRHLSKQELAIKKKLKHYELIHEGHRKRRRRNNFRTAALVGYTNTGKSTLLKALTKKDIYIADKLFATLDTAVGKMYVPPKEIAPGKYSHFQEILVSDTIGFIQDLPTDLIEAFKSTLSETIESDMLLHVIDMADPQIHEKIKVVEKILDQLGLHDKPKIYIFNKIDRIRKSDLKGVLPKADPHDPAKPRPSLMKAGKGVAARLGWESTRGKKAPVSISALRRRYRKYTPVFISAREKVNLEELKEGIVFGGPGWI